MITLSHLTPYSIYPIFHHPLSRYHPSRWTRSGHSNTSPTTNLSLSFHCSVFQQVYKKWIRQEKGFVASEGERLRVLGDLGMHPGYSAVEGGLKAPKGPLSIFTQPESAKVFGIGHTTNPVDHAAMKFEQHLACEIGKIQDEKRKEVKLAPDHINTRSDSLPKITLSSPPPSDTMQL